MEKIFEINLKALSPVSITRRKLGVLYETYTFIPAWTMWGALAKVFALSNKDDNIDYNGFKNVRLTNFYVRDNSDIVCRAEDVRRKFVSSTLKTSIDVLSNTSLEHALYEREFLFAREFVGWIKVEENSKISNFIEKELKNKTLFIGADKNTGFGKVIITNVTTEDNKSPLKGKHEREIFDGIKKSHLPDLEPKAEDNMLYLVPAEFEKQNAETGFPLVIRRWRSAGSGKAVGSGMEIVFVRFVNEDKT